MLSHWALQRWIRPAVSRLLKSYRTGSCIWAWLKAQRGAGVNWWIWGWGEKAFIFQGSMEKHYPRTGGRKHNHSFSPQRSPVSHDRQRNKDPTGQTSCWVCTQVTITILIMPLLSLLPPFLPSSNTNAECLHVRLCENARQKKSYLKYELVTK